MLSTTSIAFPSLIPINPITIPIAIVLIVCRKPIRAVILKESALVHFSEILTVAIGNQ